MQQAAVTGVEAILATGRAAVSRLALWRVQKDQGNTQRALERALEMPNKRGKEEAVRGDLKDPNEGGQKAEPDAAKVTVEVEVLRRTRDDLQQRLGLAEAQVRSLTSTLSATFTAQQAGVQRQGSGRSGSR